ncbi:MAG: TIR domain-containing protein [Rubrivivax sp.]
MGASLFISYSHLDRPWMQVFRRHLRGALMDRCEVWSDEDIPPGGTWEDRVLGNLNQASAALVLASPDYLVSPWCRRELRSLHAAMKRGQMAGVYWVQLKPCGWHWSELAEVQAVQEPASASLEDEPEGPPRDARVLRACGRITTDLLRLMADENRDLAMVRDLLARSPEGASIQLLEELRNGDFSVVCRGLHKNGDDVVVKVLTNTPLHRMRELFLQVSQARQQVRDPSVVTVDKVFTVDEGHAQRIVILSEMASGTTLAGLIEADAARPPEERWLQPERVGMILRRMAEALAKLHALPAIESEATGPEGYVHVMGPLVPGNVFFDPRTLRPRISLVGVTSFLWHFFDPVTFVRVVNPGSGSYLLPEKLRRQPLDARADQYFLGMLALELLEAERLFVVPDPLNPPDPLARLDRCQGCGARWTRHEQFGALLRRLLQPDPDQRFDTMDQVVQQFRALEEPERVLAKYAFRRWVQPAGPAADGVGFSRRFYERFFEADPAARAIFDAALARRGSTAGLDEHHHRKLVDSLKAVLNYRPGNDPSSIDTLIALHHGRGIGALQYASFRAAFVDTLAAAAEADATPAPEVAEIVRAWNQLFEPVLEEMRRKVRA